MARIIPRTARVIPRTARIQTRTARIITYGGLDGVWQRGIFNRGIID
jgi:hypothetical protein